MPHGRSTILAGAAVAALLVTGCAAGRPILYPNAKLNEVGHGQANREIAECRRIAEDIAPASRGGEVARDTAIGSGVGAATGAAGGAIYGSAGRGAAAGAAGGAVAGLLGGILRSHPPSATHRNAVNACLADRGYRVIGWE